jgi:hypothetical protein
MLSQGDTGPAIGYSPSWTASDYVQHDTETAAQDTVTTEALYIIPAFS